MSSAHSFNFTCTKLDSHADTCCLGENALILANHGKHVSVAPFISDLGKIDKVNIVTGAIAYDVPNSADIIILVVNQALYFPKNFLNNLLCPNQMRLNGLQIYE